MQAPALCPLMNILGEGKGEGERGRERRSMINFGLLMQPVSSWCLQLSCNHCSIHTPNFRKTHLQLQGNQNMVPRNTDFYIQVRRQQAALVMYNISQIVRLLCGLNTTPTCLDDKCSS